MESNPKKKKKLAWWFIGIAAACILIFLGVQNIDVVAKAVSRCAGPVSPLILGFAFALVLNVPMRFFEAPMEKTSNPFLQKLRRPIAFVTALIPVVGGFIGAGVGAIAGPIGMLLSVPIASTAYILVKEATLKREKKLGVIK